MAGKKCFEFVVKNKVQSVGLRLAIAKLIPDELDVRADNLPDGSVRVVVRGQERDVKKFWEELWKQVLGKAENPIFSDVGGVTKVPIDTNRFFHKLQCEQLEKFVDVGLDMKNSIDGMSSKIGGMDSKLGGMNSKLDSIDSKLGILPKNMAREIVKLKKQGFF